MIAALLLLAVLHAQPSHITGRILIPRRDSTAGVPHVWVTVHRVGPDHSGPVDSVTTSPTGRYTLTFRRSGAAGAVYFAVTLYNGIAYFTPPLSSATTEYRDMDITVFDTTSRPVPMTVRGRHCIIAAPDKTGTRTVTEVFDLSNDSSVTRIAPSTAARDAVWSATLPAEARTPSVATGDITPATVRFETGRALVFAPFAPGMKQLAYTYALPESAFPLSIPLEHGATIFEVLLEEPAAHADGARVRQVASVAVSGRQFQRYLASDVPRNAVARVTVPRVEHSLSLWYVAGVVIIIGAAMTLALARAVRRR